MTHFRSLRLTHTNTIFYHGARGWSRRYHPRRRRAVWFPASAPKARNALTSRRVPALGWTRPGLAREEAAKLLKMATDMATNLTMPQVAPGVSVSVVIWVGGGDGAGPRAGDAVAAAWHARRRAALGGGEAMQASVPVEVQPLVCRTRRLATLARQRIGPRTFFGSQCRTQGRRQGGPSEQPSPS